LPAYSQDDGKDDLALLHLVMQEAAEVALGFFGKNPKIWFKNNASPVSEADMAVDFHLKRQLLAARPHYGWISEESMDERVQQNYRRHFVVDPIDGTRGFLDHVAQWCISVAVIEAGRPICGMLHCPALGEQFTAQANGQARLDGQSLPHLKREPSLLINNDLQPMGASQSTAAQPCGRKHKNLLRLSCSATMAKKLPPPLAQVSQLVPSIPSLAYRLAMLAAGRLDVVLVRPHCHDWDIAAADLILQQSGGCLWDGAGKPVTYGKAPFTHGFLIAATPEIHGQIAGYFR